MNTNYSIRPLIVFVLIFVYHQSFSANRFWVGTGSGIWNNTANWSDVSGGTSGFSIPGSSDVAIFDGGGTNNCVISANLNVNGFKMTGTYNGTINVNPGITTTIGASGFSQAAGTFTGSNANISIDGTFLLTGGVFNATTGILQITGGYTYSGGTFNHNNGTVTFSLTQTISGNTSLYNIIFIANGGIYTIASGTTLSSTNNVTISGSHAYTINTGIVEIKGNLTLDATQNNSANGGTATFLFNGSGVQNITAAISTINVGVNERASALPSVEINKTSGSLNLIGLINLDGSSWKTTAGASLVNAGTSTVNINNEVTFSGQDLSLYNIHINANSQIITLSPASYILTSTHNVTINGNNHYRVETGILQILGDLTLVNTSSTTVNGGSGTFLFSGTGIQNINSSVSSLSNVCALPRVEINKSAGALNLIGIINFSGSSWNTIAGALLVNAGTSVVNLLKTTTLSGQNLSLYDIVVSGNNSTTTISSGLTWTSTHLITIAGGASWFKLNTGTLNAKGDVLVTNTNSSLNGGGNAILLFDGTSNQLLTGSGIANAGRLPQVKINKTGGILTLSNNIISMDNDWTYVAGTIDASTKTSTIDFYKSATVDGQGTSSTMVFNNVFISGLITLGGKMDINGDFTIRSGTGNQLDVNAANNYQINIAGNWVNNNSTTATSFNERSGKVVYDGGNTQTITTVPSSDIETFYNLEVNKAGGDLILNAPVTISKNLNFVTGNILSSTSYLLLINNAATATGASNNSFVSGPVRKTGNQAFVFPTGDNSILRTIAISAPGVVTDHFTANYIENDPDPLYSGTSLNANLDHVSACEYWILNRTGGSSNVAVTLSWASNSCGVDNLCDLQVSRWDGVQWTSEGNGGASGTSASGTLVSGTACTVPSPVSNFSPFTLGSISSNNPMPIKLISFKANICENSVCLFWETASEVNNDYFVVERSDDALNWRNIGTVDGAMNSSILLNYVFMDTEPINGASYYRLKQIDLGGKFEYSNIVAVSDFKNGNSALVVYPNPSNSNGIFHFMFNREKEQVLSIEVYNMLGERVYAPMNYEQSSIDLSGQQNGLYKVLFNLNTKRITVNVLLNN